MAKAKADSEVEIEETETKEKPAKKGAETTLETPAKQTDWKKAAVIAVISAIGLWFLFRRNNGEKTAPQPGKEQGNAPAGAGDRFGGLRKL